MNLADLKRPFPPEAVHWRVGSTNKDKTRGMALAYIDARDVMDRLDEVCGQANWESKFAEVGGRVVCSIGICCGNDEAYPERWAWKSDGAGDTDFEPEKGGLSDAFKRAAVQWGIGRYLYDIPATWVAIGPMGKSYHIDATELPRLRRLLAQHAPEAPTVPQDARGGAGGQDDAPELPLRSEAPLRANGGISELERFKAKLAAIENIGDLATLDAWFVKHGAQRFGVEACNELGAMIQMKLDQLRCLPK